MNVGQWLSRAAQAHPGLVAVASGTTAAFTYAQAAERAARLAGALAAGGVAPGDRVAIAARNSPEYIEAVHGAWLAGAVAVLVNAKLHSLEIAYILEHSGARTAIVDAGIESALGGETPSSLQNVVAIGSPAYRRMLAADPINPLERADGDPAWLFYTSGTTGRPKGAVLSHGNLVAMSLAYAAEVEPIAPGDAILHAAPMSHGSGLYMVPHVLFGATNIIPESGGFEPAEVFELARRWRRTSLFAAPTMVKRLVECPAEPDLASFRTIVWGGAPMYVEDCLKALDRFGPRLAQIYGLGECPMTISTLSRDDIGNSGHSDHLARLATAGRPFGCVDVAIVGEDGGRLPEGTAGEIAVRGAPVMSGYWNDSAASGQTLRDGWLHTGDVGHLDAAGYLTLSGRAKDLIISGGANIYPREVEEVLLQHPGVREVSVIGRADPDWGEIVVAYVVGEAPATELDALCLSRIARFKRPRHYVTVAELPKNNYGKVLKGDLRSLDRQTLRR